MSLPSEPTGAAQGGLGECGQCGWHGELHACRGCFERLCPSHCGEHEAACTLALDIVMREAMERMLRHGRVALLRDGTIRLEEHEARAEEEA